MLGDLVRHAQIGIHLFYRFACSFVFFNLYFSQEATVQESVENLRSPYDSVERRNVTLQSRMSGKKGSK